MSNLESCDRITAVVFAAGFGTRDLPSSKIKPKELGEVNGLPVIDYIIGDLALAGVAEVRIVVSDETVEGELNFQEMLLDRWFSPNPRYEQYLRRNNKEDKIELITGQKKGMDIRFAVQPNDDQYGTAKSWWSAQVEGNTVLVNGDDLNYRPDGGSSIGDLITAVKQSPADHGMIAMPIPRQRKGKYPYGIALTDRAGYLEEIIEKPSAERVKTRRPLANVNKFYFSEGMSDYLATYMSMSAEERGQEEFYATDVVNLAAQAGEKVLVQRGAGQFLDCGDSKLRVIAGLTVAGVSKRTIKRVRAELYK
jgi:UTP--glucose-1-phosphate uridylyltransferase